MTDRMFAQPSDPTEVSDPPAPAGSDSVDAVSVVVAITVVAGVDPTATLEAVERQGFSPFSVRLVGADSPEAPEGVVLNQDLEALVAELDTSVDYVWILHGDAEPRPDALAALVSEAERYEASLAGSKLLVAGTPDTLESVGSATDVFGEPYSGLDEGEVDLEQYDVVRDVAFVSSVSMLVRRDLLRGLRGLDSALAPVASGLDLSQRVRIAGGRVIVVPSSEVFHQSRCGRGDGGWREQSGRMRAMLKAYRPITLAWMVPFAFLTGLADSLGSLLLGRWRLIPRYALTWGWNVAHLPSTLSQRRGLARVRQVGDEELFRYQVRGSVRLRQVGSELSERVIGVFDEDRPVTKAATAAFSSATTWGLVVALFLVLIGVRSVFLGGLPAVGFSLPLGDDPSAALARFFGGWNAAGLGSENAVHPVVGITGLANAVAFGNEALARSLVTLAAFGAGVVGIGRLASRLRIGGAGGYLAGAAAVFGLPAALLGQNGRWAALIGLGLLPWALVAVTGPAPPSRRAFWGVVGRAALAVGLVSFFVPWLGLVPLLFAFGLKLVGRFPSRPLVALAATPGALVGVPHALWRSGSWLEGVPVPVEVGTFPLLVVTVTALLAMVAGSWRASGLGAVMALGGLTAARATGPDIQEALLAVAAVGVGVVVAAALRPRGERDPVQWLALAAGVLLLAVSLAGLAGGRAGMAADAWSDLDFLQLSAEGEERALLIAARPDELPGESRPGPGFWYRLVDSRGPTMDQAWLNDPGEGDVALRGAVDQIATGATLEPGELLAPFGVRWVIVVGDAVTTLGPALDAQVDLAPLPLAEGLVVYENAVHRTVAEGDDGTVWNRDGTGFSGPATDGRVRLAIQAGSGWHPGFEADTWAGTVDGDQGRAWFGSVTRDRYMVTAGLVVLVAGIVLAVWARRTRP